MAGINMSDLTRALNLTRRDLLKGAAGGAAGLLVAGSAGKALASSAAKAAAKPLHGRGGDDPSYTLTAAPVGWNVGGGRLVSAWAFNGTVPGPTLYANAGDTLTITVVNSLPEPTSVHWHGVEPIPNNQDGVAFVTQAPIASGGSLTYTFPAPAPGTYAYHSHFNTSHQVPRGLYGLLVVNDPKPGLRAANPGGSNSSQRRYNREYPLVLSSFPAEHAVGTWVPPGLDEIQLINGKTFYPLDPSNGVITIPDLGAFVAEMAGYLVFPMSVGDRVLFRTINLSAEEAHPWHSHGMHFTVVAEDAFDLAFPYDRCTLAVNPGERYDWILHPEVAGLWVYHCHNLGHVAEGMIAVNAVS